MNLELSEVLGSVGAGMPVPHADNLAGHLAGLCGPTAVGKHAAKMFIPAPAFTEACNRIRAAWQHSPDTPGVALALGVSAAAHAAAAARAEHSDDLVVTGPSSWQVPTTSTSQAVRSVNHNLEVGILIRGGNLPNRLQKHFEQLEAAGTLVTG